MIDSHTHLNSPILFPNRKEHILDFEKNWGNGLVNVWADEEYNQNGIIISKEYDGNVFVKCTIWYSPHEILANKISDDNVDNKVNELRKLYLENKNHIVAIWEIWIDTHFDGWSSLVLQKRLFKMQCELAKEFWLPIVIHSRDDFDTTMEVLENFKELKIYFHCRWYGPKEIEKVQNNFNNIWIGFCGNITYPKAQNIRDSLLACDIDNILIETDAPYLSPQNLRGETNSPANIMYTYEFISNEIKLDMDYLIYKIENNFKKLYQ
jgi:TatD DNase family protein